jgi:hypothetical protein
VPNHLGSCYSEPKDVAVPELPERQGDGNGGRVIRRLGGRPTTLAPALSEQIIALVRDVGALATAARCAGVPVSVAREWLARGFGNDANSPRTALYASFADVAAADTTRPVDGWVRTRRLSADDRRARRRDAG